MSFCLGKRIPVGAGKWPQTQDACALPGHIIMGRKGTAEPRDRQFNLSLTTSELESLKQRAQAVGMRPVHFGRALLLDAGRRPAAARDEDSNLSHLIYSQLVRLGNNLNQLVRHLHRTGDPLPADLEPLLNDIRQIIARRFRHDR